MKITQIINEWAEMKKRENKDNLHHQVEYDRDEAIDLVNRMHIRTVGFDKIGQHYDHNDFLESIDDCMRFAYDVEEIILKTRGREDES